MQAQGDSDSLCMLGDSDFWQIPAGSLFQCDAGEVLESRCMHEAALGASDTDFGQVWLLPTHGSHMSWCQNSSVTLRWHKAPTARGPDPCNLAFAISGNS